MSKIKYVCIFYIIDSMKKILFAFASLLIAAGVQAQKTHPDISSLLVKATIDPSVIKGPVKQMNAVNNGPNRSRWRISAF